MIKPFSVTVILCAALDVLGGSVQMIETSRVVTVAGTVGDTNTLAIDLLLEPQDRAPGAGGETPGTDRRWRVPVDTNTTPHSFSNDVSLLPGTNVVTALHPAASWSTRNYMLDAELNSLVFYVKATLSAGSTDYGDAKVVLVVDDYSTCRTNEAFLSDGGLAYLAYTDPAIANYSAPLTAGLYRVYTTVKYRSVEPDSLDVACTNIASGSGTGPDKTVFSLNHPKLYDEDAGACFWHVATTVVHLDDVTGAYRCNNVDTSATNFTRYSRDMYPTQAAHVRVPLLTNDVTFPAGTAEYEVKKPRSDYIFTVDTNDFLVYGGLQDGTDVYLALGDSLQFDAHGSFNSQCTNYPHGSEGIIEQFEVEKVSGSGVLTNLVYMDGLWEDPETEDIEGRQGLGVLTGLKPCHVTVECNDDDPDVFVSCGRTYHVYVIDVDLDVDSDNNNGFDASWTPTDAEDLIEDDACEHGKIIGVSIGDTDGDGVPDYADGFDADGDPSTIEDNESSHLFVPLKLSITDYSWSTFPSATVVFAYSGAPPNSIAVTNETVDWSTTNRVLYSQTTNCQLRLWTKDGDQIRNSDDLDAGGDYLAPGVAYTVADLLDGSGKVVVYAEALSESLKQSDVLVEASVDVIGGTNGFPDRIRMTALKADLQLRSKNDLALELSDPENEQWEDVEPFAFWLNDNSDSWVPGVDDNDLPGINGTNDLLDLAPFAVDIPDVIAPTNLPSGFKYRLRIDHPFSDYQNFEIRVFHHEADTTNLMSAAEKEYAYLRAEDAATTQVAASKVDFDGTVSSVVTAGSPRRFKDVDTGSGGQKKFVFEGEKWGKARLYFELIDTTLNRVVASDSAILEMPEAPAEGGRNESVAGLFGEWNLRGNPYSWTQSSKLPVNDLTTMPEADWWRRNPADPSLPAEDMQSHLDRCTFYVHGFNEPHNETRRKKQRPIFRRLYWGGVKIHRYQSSYFIAVHWPGDYGLIGIFDGFRYNIDTVNAFYSGKAFGKGLRDQQNNPGGILQNVDFHLIAHSLGNCVVGKAIQQEATVTGGGAVIKSYTLLESAVTASVFENETSPYSDQKTNLFEYAEETGYNTNAPNIGPHDLVWATNWAQPTAMFGPPGDGWTSDGYGGYYSLNPLYGPYPSNWTDENWRIQWTNENSKLIEIRKDEAGISGTASNVYATRWMQDKWGPDHDPWRGQFSNVLDYTSVHNFVTHTNEGPYVSDVLRWEPGTPEYLWWIPIPGTTHACPWHACQKHARPQNGHTALSALLDASSNDPDGKDMWDTDLKQEPWDVPSGTFSPPMDLDLMRESRHFAELAHYFVELSLPAGMNEIVDLGWDDNNHTLVDLGELMDAQHSYFVVNERYWIVYDQVYKVIAGYIND